MTYVWPRAVFN